jgi:hypothetical protein
LEEDGCGLTTRLTVKERWPRCSGAPMDGGWRWRLPELILGPGELIDLHTREKGH